MIWTGDVTQPKDLDSALCDLSSSLVWQIGSLEFETIGFEVWGSTWAIVMQGKKSKNAGKV